MWLASFLTELRRRRLFRMTAWYVIAGWVFIQVASEALPALDLDERIIRYVWLAVLGGFPIAVIFSWRYDVTTQGIRCTATGPEVAPKTLELPHHPPVNCHCMALGGWAVADQANVPGRLQR